MKGENCMTRLLRRFAILAVLVIGTMIVVSERQANTVFAVNYCNYCNSTHSQCTNYCASDYNTCVQNNGGSVCNDNLYWCVLQCDNSKTFCDTNCNTGGGGGGPYPKGSCGADCYDARGECLFGDPPEWIEDCLTNGGNRHTCCNEVFYDCMAGC